MTVGDQYIYNGKVWTLELIEHTDGGQWCGPTTFIHFVSAQRVTIMVGIAHVTEEHGWTKVDWDRMAEQLQAHHD